MCIIGLVHLPYLYPSFAALLLMEGTAMLQENVLESQQPIRFNSYALSTRCHAEFLSSCPRHCCCCRAPLCRKMIVVSGVYANSGDVAPLLCGWF
jgi:hypothetical protein